MPGKASRDKGQRLEREIRALHEAAGLPCERVPLSGAAGGTYTGDLLICNHWHGEVKGRASGQGFTTIKRWLGTNDVLFLREDRANPLVVMPWAKYEILMQTSGMANGQ